MTTTDCKMFGGKGEQVSPSLPPHLSIADQLRRTTCGTSLDCCGRCWPFRRCARFFLAHALSDLLFHTDVIPEASSDVFEFAVVLVLIRSTGYTMLQVRHTI